MGIRGKFKLRKDGPDHDREPPPREEWPTHVKRLDTEDFADFIERYPVSFIDFHSPDCGPCRAIAPQIRLLSKRYRYRVAFGKVNVRENIELASRYRVQSVPNLMVFSYGKKVTAMLGRKSTGDLKKAIEEGLSRSGG